MRSSRERLIRRLSDRHPVVQDAAGRTEAAVAIILAPRDSGHQLLLIKRAESAGDPWSGQMALPGGRRESGDEDLVATAMRETREETRIELRRDLLVGQLDDLAPTIAALPPVLVRPFVFVLGEAVRIQPGPEVAFGVWTAFDLLGASEKDVEIEIRGAQRTVPAFLVGHHVVWGMTHRIIKSFIELSDRR
jgi:8-oxo-dGTP pyrophosphatase MutT (NUDIX family)